MVKKNGLFLLFLGLSCFGIAMGFSQNFHKLTLLVLISTSLASSFLGIFLLAIQGKSSNHKKYKAIFLTTSLVLLAICITSSYYGWYGANIEGVLAVFCYCFAYAPMELHLKNAKWRVYSNNKWEMLLLSSLDFVGINLILLGVLSRALHWPGQYSLIYIGASVLFVGLFLWNARFKHEVIQRKKTEDMIKTQYQQIEQEMHKSDNLLLNILPAEVVEELKSKGSTEAKQFDMVTVLFTDFVNFTQISEKMTPSELVEEIHTCFMAFDNIMEKHGIEKIKTIGDSYMCVGGLPVPNKTHATDVVEAALEIQQFISSRAEKRIVLGKEPFLIRIGIHSGPVVAGIVGIKKFAYDIWGDTVNTASRMESCGEVGKINISDTTYSLIKNMFVCTPRGKIEVKGKGEQDMFFVQGRI